MSKASKIWKVCATLFLTAYVAFTLLNRFVMPQNIVLMENADTSVSSNAPSAPSNATEATSEQATETTQSPIITDTSYTSENIQITLETIRQYNTDIYIAEIIVSDSSFLKTGLAENSFGTNVKEKTSVIAEEHNAILAINGDYYGFRDSGYVMRNGYLYRDIQADNGNDDLVIYQDGSWEIIEEQNISAQELAEMGALQIFSFGPGLIADGNILVDENSQVDREDPSNPRTAVGMIDSGHYIFMVADGRTEENEGLSLQEMAEVLDAYDCDVAYNLDGGGSSTMVFMGEVVNNPTTNGRDVQERSVSDIVYIGES